MADNIMVDYELPGEGYDFQDVTNLFQEAASGRFSIQGKSEILLIS